MDPDLHWLKPGETVVSIDALRAMVGLYPKAGPQHMTLNITHPEFLRAWQAWVEEQRKNKEGDMAKQAAPAEQEISGKLNTEMLRRMAFKVCQEGFVPADVLQEEFGPEDFTCGVAILFRTYRVFREVRRPWTEGKEVKGYEWADRRFSKSEQTKIPPELGFLVELSKKVSVRYGEYELISVRCRYTTPAVGGQPTKDAEGEFNGFERDYLDNLLILAYGLRAMAAKALPMIGKEAAIARRIGFQAVRFASPKTFFDLRPVIDEQKRQGLGITRHEAIVAGTEFVIRAMVPLSVLSPPEYLRMLKIAGEFVRLSPGRSAGCGEFEVLGMAE